MAGRRPEQFQRGAALLIFMILLVMSTLTYMVSSLTPELADALRVQKTNAALAQARAALIWYAETFRERQNKIQIDAGGLPPNYVQGYLPLPDLGTNNNTNIGCTTEGCDANLSGSALHKTVVGRFPWALFGTGPLRDGHGECLWYIVSGSHQRVDKNPVMNWDTLGETDIVTTNEFDSNPAKRQMLKSLLAGTHDRPVAIIFSAGPPLGTQNRSANDGNTVTQCKGNYTPANYLDPSLAAALLNSDGSASTSVYFSGAVSTSNTDTASLAIATQGKIYQDGTATNLKKACPSGNTNCPIVANDVGLEISPGMIFDTIRKSGYFRQDINSMLDRMVSCLRDAYFGAGSLPAYDKISAYPSTCYADTQDPQNYYSHYGEMIFVAPSTSIVANGITCNGALMFAGQRSSTKSPTPTDPDESITQLRNVDAVSTSNPAANKDWPRNYLEGINVTNFLGGGTSFSGPEIFERVSNMQSASQDIVRCIPTTPSFVTTTSQALTNASLPLVSYTPTTQTLTLGRAQTSALSAIASGSLYACAWKPETHAMGHGLRSYFSFIINDPYTSSGTTAEGITFAIVDGDNNDDTACGAARQHLGYSGNNGESAFIVPPKIAFEIDTRREGTFNPSASDPLSNGRNDPYSSPTSTGTPKYVGGHVAFVYWGGDTAISALAPEQDDNVHNHPVPPYALGRTNFPLPPANPGIPDPPLTEAGPPQGFYKLDPGLNSVPTGQIFHVRVELTRSSTANLAKARVATTSAIPNLNVPGITAIDNIILFTSDRVLVKNQTNAAENGIYVWNGSTSAMTRASDFDNTQELNGAVVEISQGAINARSLWRQSTANPIINTSALNWHDLHVKVAVATVPTLPASIIDGIRMKTGDRILVKNSGLYVWQNDSTLTSVPSYSGTVVQVQQGSDASGLWHYDGITWSRQPVRVATQSNITLAAPGDTIDGVDLSSTTEVNASNKHILVKSQTTASENGLYVWTSATTPLTLSTWPAGGLMQVLEGTDAGRAFHQSDTTTWSSIDGSPSFTLEAWIKPNPGELEKAAMKNTTRPMSFLKSDFPPHLHTTPKIPYPFRNVRLGFTVGQRNSTTSTMDQTFTISNQFTTWID